MGCFSNCSLLVKTLARPMHRFGRVSKSVGEACVRRGLKILNFNRVTIEHQLRTLEEWWQEVTHFVSTPAHCWASQDFSGFDCCRLKKKHDMKSFTMYSKTALPCWCRSFSVLSPVFYSVISVKGRVHNGVILSCTKEASQSEHWHLK